MKGLLLKDFYMAKKYCKVYLLIALVFIAASFAEPGNMFLIFYPCLLSGILPVNLLSYDERFKWNEYSGTLPYTRAQIVSVKYLIGLFAQLFIFTLTLLAQLIRMNFGSGFTFPEFIVLAELLLCLSLFTTSLSLPLMFKLGVEKGRIVFFILIGTVAGVSAAASGVFSSGLQTLLQLNTILPVLCAAGVAAFALSWYLSVVFYKKREL